MLFFLKASLGINFSPIIWPHPSKMGKNSFQKDGFQSRMSGYSWYEKLPSSRAPTKYLGCEYRVLYNPAIVFSHTENPISQDTDTPTAPTPLRYLPMLPSVHVSGVDTNCTLGTSPCGELINIKQLVTLNNCCALAWPFVWQQYQWPVLGLLNYDRQEFVILF